MLLLLIAVGNKNNAFKPDTHQPLADTHLVSWYCFCLQHRYVCVCACACVRPKAINYIHMILNLMPALLIASICACHTHLHNLSALSYYSCTDVKTTLSVKQMTFTALIILVSVMMGFVTKAMPMPRQLFTFPKMQQTCSAGCTNDLHAKTSCHLLHSVH